MTIDANTFCAFEQQQSLFNIRINNVPIWERIRFGVWREIKQQHGTGQAHTSVNKTLQDYLAGGLLFAKNLIYRNPFFAEESNLMFVGHERRKKQEDGFWWDIYCDPIHNACEYEYVHFETDYLLDHLSPAKTDNLRYLDLIQYSGIIQKLLPISGVSLSKSDRHKLRQLEGKFSNEFSVNVNLVERVERKLGYRKAILPLYRKLLKRINPNLVLVVVGYGNETLIEACDEQDIPVAELQHGVIYKNHFGYSYSGSRNKESFPDYILVWGEFWKKAVEFPLPDERVIPVGYPYLEQSAKMYSKSKQKDQLLFISQGTIGKELSKFAVEVDQHPDIKHDLVYKLHPGEYNRWETEYPWLIGTDIEVIDSPDPPLYQLFSESCGQIGVYSTAVYEGLYFGLETYLYECPGEEILQPLLNNGTAKLVTSPKELASVFENGSQSFSQEYYFCSNATEQVCNVINQLATNGTSLKNPDSKS